MSGTLDAIFSAIRDFLTWLFGLFSPPKRKTWGAIFYYVAQEDPGLSYPETALDAQLEATLQALKEVNRDDMHIVYRAVWADPLKAPEASVVGPLFPPHTDYFRGCSSSHSTPVVIGDDMRCFFKWAYKWCPADHYAVFFWGHSFGPAGLFEPGGPVGIPMPTGLASLREAFEEFVNARRADQPPQEVAYPVDSQIGVPPADQTPVTGEEIAAVVAWASADPKVEIVLFQDCWMSTLETAFELPTVARYLVGSQSLVPVGGKTPDFIWQYDSLLADLTMSTPLASAKQMCTRLIDFYDGHFNPAHNPPHIPDLATVPFSVLDLSAVPKVRERMANLVTRLNAVAPVPRDKGMLIEPSIIARFSATADPTLGDPVLVDVGAMCQRLQGHDDGPLAQYATQLSHALTELVAQNAEAVRPNGNSSGFTGVSALYRPPVDRVVGPSLVSPALRDAIYLGLQLPAKTGWPALEN